MIALASSVWPAPMKPYKPRTSPRRRVKLTSVNAFRRPSARASNITGWVGATERSVTSPVIAPSSVSWPRPIMASMSQPLSTLAASTVATFRALRNTVTRSEISSTSSKKWDTKTNVCPCARNRRRTSNSRRTSGGDKADVGSSRMTMRAPLNRTRESSISCCKPSGSAPARNAGSISIPSVVRW